MSTSYRLLDPLALLTSAKMQESPHTAWLKHTGPIHEIIQSCLLAAPRTLGSPRSPEPALRSVCRPGSASIGASSAALQQCYGTMEWRCGQWYRTRTCPGLPTSTPSWHAFGLRERVAARVIFSVITSHASSDAVAAFADAERATTITAPSPLSASAWSL